MKAIALIVAVILAIMVLSRLRSSPGSPKSARAARAAVARPASRYRAVSINCGADACEAARALVGKRFFPEDMGQLPLTGCTASRCECTYSHHNDRRSAGGDKRARSALSTELYQASGKPERRGSRGRRKSDYE